MTHDELEQAVRELIKAFLRTADQVAEIKLHLRALRETLDENEPAALSGLSGKEIVLMNAYLDRLQTGAKTLAEMAESERLRRMLEAFEGPKQ